MSVVRLLVLGSVIRNQPAHGYRILSDLKKWRVETWTSVKSGSIYHAITQLEKQQFLVSVESRADKKLGPAKTEYRLTQAGRTEFFALLHDALLSLDIEDFSAGVVFMSFLTRDAALALLQERVTKLREVPTFLDTLPTNPQANDPSQHPELITTWSAHMNDMANATEAMIQRITSGAYTFNE